ncbi:MAG: hypothetical protein E3J72_12090 [Planctomycetota bacterium]|nr:MAG: hypothetical protein E3J72_12090 [Planctomycetota bacterium]
MGNENQVSISYIGNLAHTPPDDVLLVENDGDYVRACHTLSHREKSDIGLKVWVRSKNHFAWLRDFTEQIDCSSKFEEKTPRLVLAEQWNVQIPEWLTDTDVLDFNLLDIPVDSQKQTDFENRLLIHLLGAAFQPDMLISAHLVDVIKALVSDEAKAAFKKYPVLRRCFETKCEQWAKRSSETWVKDICRQLPENSNEVWQWLSLWVGLHGYPEKLLEYVLAPEQVLLIRKVPPDVINDLPLESTAKEQMLTQIELLFKETWEQVTSSDMFRKVVRWTSGRLLKEYHFISSILRNNRFPPTEEDVQEVQTKFRYCPGVSENQLNALRYCVKPDRPTLLGLEEEWSSVEWIRWTAEEYVPYRTWQVHNGYYDEDLEQTVARFTDWYIAEYTSIHKDPDLSLTHCLRVLSSNRSENEFSIILLIDCLLLAFMDILDDALRNVGFSRHNLHYRFAALPTITEYNKAALLSGEWQEKTGSYEAILKTRANTDWGGKQVVYLSNLKSMLEMAAPQEATIVVLNFVDGDELLHSDVESKNITYEDELHRLFTRMAESVSKLSQEWSGPREQLSVYVVTDHGACRILEEEKRSFDSTVVNRLFANEKHRFSAVAEDQIDEIPENLWVLGHRFKRPFISENTVYFLPKGHNTVRQAGRVKGYIHGGVTPEEVIVPAAQYKLVKAAWKTLATRFLNLDQVRETGRAKFYIQRVVTLEVEIQNPNPSDVRVFRASIMSPETDLKSCETVVIPAGSVNTLQMNCYFKKAALGERSLEIEIAYEIAGNQHTLPLTLESEFRSAIASGFSLRDL